MDGPNGFPTSEIYPCTLAIGNNGVKSSALIFNSIGYIWQRGKSKIPIPAWVMLKLQKKPFLMIGFWSAFRQFTHCLGELLHIHGHTAVVIEIHPFPRLVEPLPFPYPDRERVKPWIGGRIRAFVNFLFR
ncbi:MAG: hypothetical protein L3J84_10405 [Gammaproteobacteria bacterium]|nr:hypothetical protein [Gammaproteobacteria bacterium]